MIKLTRKGYVRLYGNTEYAARRDMERAYYAWLAKLMRGWKRVYSV